MMTHNNNTFSKKPRTKVKNKPIYHFHVFSIDILTFSYNNSCITRIIPRISWPSTWRTSGELGGIGSPFP